MNLKLKECDFSITLSVPDRVPLYRVVYRIFCILKHNLIIRREIIHNIKFKLNFHIHMYYIYIVNEKSYLTYTYGLGNKIGEKKENRERIKSENLFGSCLFFHKRKLCTIHTTIYIFLIFTWCRLRYSIRTQWERGLDFIFPKRIYSFHKTFTPHQRIKKRLCWYNCLALLFSSNKYTGIYIRILYSRRKYYYKHIECMC